MKKYCFLLFLLSNILVSQTTDKNNMGSVSGKILDFKTHKKIPYVSITCLDKNNKIIGGSISNNKGIFSIKNLVLDSITIKLQFIGFEELKSKFILTKEKPNLNLPTFYLKEEINSLDEISIKTETSSLIQKIDRKVFNVGKDLNSAGTNSLQLLENIPSVSVDFQTGAINLRGNENVRILVDGKPSNLAPTQLLKQIPSSTIKSVEIITNPSAKYNPEGMSGIINIILKKNITIGFNGSFSAGAEHSINTRPTTSFDFNYRTGKINIYGNYGLDWGNFETFSNFKRLDKNLIQDINFLDNTTSHYAKVGLDFYINNKNTLSFYTTQNFSDTGFNVNTTIVENQNLLFNAKNLSVFNTSEAIYNLDYILNFNKKGEQLELEINYAKSKSPQEDTITDLANPNSNVYNYFNSIINNTNTLLINFDYTKPIKNGVLEFGLESRNQKNTNSIVTNQEIETNTNTTAPRGNSNFTYNRDIYSGYVNVNKEYEKLSLQVGLRIEQFNVDGLFFNTQQNNLEPYSDRIFSLYPSAFITFSNSEKHQFQLGYSRRVDRPGIEQVSPIQEWTSPLSISTGNRTLEPQFTNSLEFTYTNTIKKGYLNFGIFYRKTSDVIGRIFISDITNPDRQILSYENYDKAISYGFEFSSSFKPLKWWTIRPSANIYFQENKGFINNSFKTVNNTLFRARVNNSFKATKKLRFNASASYRGKNKNLLATINPYFLVNASMSYSILNGNGTLNIRATDIFDNYKLDFVTQDPFLQQGSFTLEYSAIYAGFTYNFGKGSNRERDRKYRENKETQGSGGVL